jgi:glutamate N-acetyltransferase/amino-acid N-acetyltransferase
MQEQFSLPQGFRTAGVHCGIKADAEKFDLALFAADGPSTAVGVFTQNRVCGAPVKVSRERLPRATVRAVVINSGNANACTGERGLQDARWMTAAVAERLGCAADDVLVCSTGVIGHFLPRAKLETGIPQVFEQLADSPEAFANAARGMMTTDTFHKQSVRQAEVGGKTVTVAGAAKGAAMIAPNMATMLAVVMTDAVLSSDEADAMLREAVDRSFNCINVEGHTSTSDSVILLASGAAENGPLDDEGRQRLQSLLNEVTEELATAIIRDAEGAGHFITVDVRGLATRANAHCIARTVADDVLVKTAITGNDPNWGRIVSACGRTGVELGEEHITLRINGTLIYQSGAPVDYDEAAVSRFMRDNRDVHIELDLTLGDESARFWTCDLTQEYVRLNSELTT